MATFKDLQNRDWVVRISAATIKRVRTALQLELHKLTDEACRPLGELMRDPVRVVEVLYVLCEGQVTAAGLDAERFGELFAGDVLAAATNALIEALIEFEPSAERRQSIRAIIAAARDYEQKAAAHLLDIVNNLDPHKIAADALRAVESETAGAQADGVTRP